MSFATTLQTLRKKAGLTQEQLASKFGVSAQAVSKWENGSFPEGDLIPKIADEFGVSIDYLYGREERKVSLEQQVVSTLTSLEKEGRGKKDYDFWKLYMEQVQRLIWAFHVGAWSENNYYFERPRTPEDIGETDSAVLNKYGYSFMRLNKDHEYYIFLRQPEGEEGFLKWLPKTEKIAPVLNILADPESARVLLYMYTLKSHEYAVAETVSKETGVPKEKVVKTLETLSKDVGPNSHPMRQLCIVKGEGKEEAAYGIDKTLSGLLIGVIALLDSYTNSSQSYMLQINDRTDSWINRKK